MLSLKILNFLSSENGKSPTEKKEDIDKVEDTVHNSTEDSVDGTKDVSKEEKVKEEKVEEENGRKSRSASPAK